MFSPFFCIGPADLAVSLIDHSIYHSRGVFLSIYIKLMLNTYAKKISILCSSLMPSPDSRGPSFVICFLSIPLTSCGVLCCRESVLGSYFSVTSNDVEVLSLHRALGFLQWKSLRVLISGFRFALASFFFFFLSAMWFVIYQQQRNYT